MGERHGHSVGRQSRREGWLAGAMSLQLSVLRVCGFGSQAGQCWGLRHGFDLLADCMSARYSGNVVLIVGSDVMRKS